MLVGFLGRLELLGNFLPHPSASTLTSSIVVSSQISTSFPCSVEFYLLVYNPSRSYLTPECEFHLNQARSLSYLYVSPNKTCRSTNSRFPTFNLTLCARTSREVQPVVHVRNVLRFLVRDTKNGDLLYILRIVMLLLFSATLGGGVTGVIREPRHRPLLLAVDQPLLQAYRPARGRRAVRSCASVIPVSLCTGEAFRLRE